MNNPSQNHYELTKDQEEIIKNATEEDLIGILKMFNKGDFDQVNPGLKDSIKERINNLLPNADVIQLHPKEKNQSLKLEKEAEILPFPVKERQPSMPNKEGKEADIIPFPTKEEQPVPSKEKISSEHSSYLKLIVNNQ